MRLLIASVLVIGLMHTFARALIEPMIPVYRDEVELLTPEVTIVSADLTSEMIRFRVRVSRPIRLADGELMPFRPSGSIRLYDLTFPLDRVLVYCAIALILVLAWPTAGIREFIVRAAASVPLMAPLLLIDPATMIVDVHRLGRWMALIQALHDGGGLVVGCLMAGLAILAGKRMSAQREVSVPAAPPASSARHPSTATDSSARPLIRQVQGNALADYAWRWRGRLEIESGSILRLVAIGPGEVGARMRGLGCVQLRALDRDAAPILASSVNPEPAEPALVGNGIGLAVIPDTAARRCRSAQALAS